MPSEMYHYPGQAVAVEKAMTEEQAMRSRMGMVQSKEGPREFMTATEMVNLLANDVSQLLDEITSLRARLSPLLAEKEHKARVREAYPVRCELAARLGDIHLQVLHARECVEYTQIQLDL